MFILETHITELRSYRPGIYAFFPSCNSNFITQRHHPLNLAIIVVIQKLGQMQTLSYNKKYGTVYALDVL